jgi:predicted DNA-binding protein with PD1-like motif
MNYKKINNKYVIRMDRGEELVSSLKRFCSENNIKLGSVTGLGATDKVTIGLFIMDEKRFKSKEFTGDFEITSLVGNISTMNGETYIHLHANIGDIEHRVFGGHLASAVISATAEIFVDTIDGEVDRVFDEESGINLLKL